jgi:hypothetical protein
MGAIATTTGRHFGDHVFGPFTGGPRACQVEGCTVVRSGLRTDEPTQAATDAAAACSPYEPAQVAQLARYAQQLLEGRQFAMTAASERSVFGYQPPMARRGWSHVVATLGLMAAEADWLAQAAAAILATGQPNLYGTDSEARARVYEAAGRFVQVGTWDDVLARSGPEPVRHSAAQRAITLAMRLRLLVWLNEATAPLQHAVPTIGWCADALARALHVRTDVQGVRR